MASEKAREISVNGHYRAMHFTMQEAVSCTAEEIDAAVAPLVAVCDALADRLRVDVTTDRRWIAEQVKALEQWRK